MAQAKNNALTPMGYGIHKRTRGFKRTHECRRDLTVAPRTVPGFGPARPRSYPVYRESGDHMYLPRHYGIQKFGDPAETTITPGAPVPRLKFKGSLRPLQRKAVAAFEATLGPGGDEPPSARYPHGGILSLHCGAGKTVIALYLAARVGRKAIVVVHKEFLVHQWHERIRQFLPDARVGLIQQKKADVHGKDIVIAMLQSLSLREYPPQVLGSFGTAIFDECHHLSSEVFSRCLPKIGARVTLGLSATPAQGRPHKGLQVVPRGRALQGGAPARPAHRAVRARRATRRKGSRVRRGATRRVHGEPQHVRHGQPYRGKLATNRAGGALARAVVAEEPRRQVIVLSGRRRHLDDIRAAILEHPVASAIGDVAEADVGYYVGGMGQTALKQSEGCRVVLATYSMAAEGLDIKSLNSLIFATPMSDVTQAVGRILRAVDPEVPPRIIDMVDDYSCFSRQAQKRRRIYKKQGFLDVVETSPDAPASAWAGQAQRLLATPGATPRVTNATEPPHDDDDEHLFMKLP